MLCTGVKTSLKSLRSRLVICLQMIDEVHTLIGAGAAEGAIDAANILKPALARGELQCIGATTLDEYRKHIEKDPALERWAQMHSHVASMARADVILGMRVSALGMAASMLPQLLLLAGSCFSPKETSRVKQICNLPASGALNAAPPTQKPHVVVVSAGSSSAGAAAGLVPHSL